MRLNDLVDVLNYLNRFFTQSNPLAIYQSMVNTLNQLNTQPNVPGRPRNVANQHIPPTINSIKEQLIACQEKVSIPDNWTFLKREIFKKLGAEKILGQEAIININQAYSKNALNSVGMSQEFQKLLTEINQLQTKVNQLLSGLQNLVDGEKSEDVKENEIVMQLSFQGDISIKSIHDLKEYSDDWQKIISAFSRFCKQEPETARIINIEKGSFIIDVAVTALTAKWIAKGFSEILTLVEKYYLVKKLAKEARKTELDDREIKEAIETIEKRATSFLEDQSKNISAKLFSENSAWTAEEIKGDEENFMSVALRLISKFVEKGGKVEFLLKENLTEQEAKDAEVFHNVRSAELKIDSVKLYLENNSNDKK